MKNFIFVFASMLWIGATHAEPYLANRYAQNCAACHAPGRLNKPAAGRRCTLSCQGCHVNPQGGGMRNQYGIWNQQRWLRSFRTEMFKDKPTPAPLDRQPYYERMKMLASKATEYYGKYQPKAESPKAGKKSSVAAKDVPKSGDRYPIRWIKGVDPAEKYFDKHSYDEWYAVVYNEDEFASVVPEGDPYHLERDLSIYASGDFRYFAMNADNDTLLLGKKQRTWLMASDIGVRLRPTKYHQLSAVVEARFANAPTGGDPEDGFTSGAIAKSAYILVDDLAYNSFVQAGLYRPMFGNYDPDHNSLSSLITGLTYDKTFKAFGVGVAPNVPFFIANYIQPYSKSAGEDQTSDGFAVTGGLRFVTLGASAALSYWNTEFLEGLSTKKRQMYALTGGLTYKKFIVNLEFVRAQLSDNTGAKNAGNVITLQNKYRIFRENYAVLNFATANTATDLTEGSGQETMLGAKSFLMSNFELEALYIMRKYKDGGVKTDVNTIQVQGHIFF